MRSIRTYSFGVSVVALSLILAVPARAQAQEASADQRAQEDDIIVTARRREENIQSVPISITVVSQQTLQQNNIQTIGALQYLVPSMSVTTGLTRDAPNVSIRGQGASGLSGLPGVIAYLNEVPVPTDKDGNLAGGPGLLFDLENVQVLKGPVGTLFGRNAVGGALLLTSARPKNELSGRIQLGYGNYNNREIEAAINIPIVSDKLLMRVAFIAQKRDGFTRLLADPAHPNGVDADNRDFWATRASVTFRPNDWFENDSILTYSKFDSNGSPLILTHFNPGSIIGNFFPSFAAQFAQQQTLGIRAAVPVSVALESSGSNLALDNITKFKLSDDITLKNIFGFDRAKTAIALDLDSTANVILDLPSVPRHQTVNQFTEELQLVGKSFGGKLDWIIGGFYLNQPPTYHYVNQISAGFGGPSAFRQGAKSKAVFSQGTYDLSGIVSGFKLTLGARYTWDNRFYSERTGPVGPCIILPPNDDRAVTPVCTSSSVGETQSKAFTWTTGLDYQVSPDTLLYLAMRRGYRAGGANFGISDGNGKLVGYDPEYVTDVELGIKSDFVIAGIPIRTNAAVYRQNYTDIQVLQSQFINGGLLFVTSNAASARLWGAEVEVLAHLTPDFQVGGNFTYLDFKYTKFGPGVDVAALTAGLNGGRVPYKYGLNARYRLPLDPKIGEITMRAYWNWQDSSGLFEQPGGVIEKFGLLNLNLDWEGIGGTQIDASVFVSNATNKVYKLGGIAFYNSLGYSNQRFGEPRMFGFRLGYRFGGNGHP